MPLAEIWHTNVSAHFPDAAVFCDHECNHVISIMHACRRWLIERCSIRRLRLCSNGSVVGNISRYHGKAHAAGRVQHPVMIGCVAGSLVHPSQSFADRLLQGSDRCYGVRPTSTYVHSIKRMARMVPFMYNYTITASLCLSAHKLVVHVQPHCCCFSHQQPL